jgi:hypothetical protein
LPIFRGNGLISDELASADTILNGARQMDDDHGAGGSKDNCAAQHRR